MSGERALPPSRNREAAYVEAGYVGGNAQELRLGLEIVGGVVLGLVLAGYLIVRFSKKNR